jgi:hypothetical protein
VALAWSYYQKNKGPHGLTERSGLFRAGYRFLENKYYLTTLHRRHRRRLLGPDRPAAYWFNMKASTLS